MQKRYDLHYNNTILNISRKFSLIQQMIWNYMLVFASKNICNNQEHKISVSRLVDYLSFRNSKEICNKIYKMENFSEKNDLSYHFETIKIINNTIYYKYPLKLIFILSSPCVWQTTEKLKNLKFSSKFSLFLYEFCLYYQLLECTHIVPIHAMRNFMSLSNNQYANFKSFHNSIIALAIYEINTKTTLNVKVKYVKSGKSVIGLHFNIKDKTNNTKNDNFKNREENFKFFTENVAYSRFLKLSENGIDQFNLKFKEWTINKNFKRGLTSSFEKEILKKEFIYNQCLAPYEMNIHLWENRS